MMVESGSTYPFIIMNTDRSDKKVTHWYTKVQKVQRDTCGMYQIYFYVNLFNRLEDSSIISKKRFNKQTIEKLVNEIL